jgi:hypothetical protein
MTKQTEWVQVGELAEGFAPDSNKLDIVDELAGKAMVLFLDNGTAIKHSFDTGSTLTWEVLEGKDKGERGTEEYTATSIRSDIYFIDFIKASETATSVNIVMNIATSNATLLVAALPSESETMRAAFARVTAGDLLTGVDAQFFQASIDRPYEPGMGHPETQELIGKRVQYDYSPHEKYEHIYLNSNYYCWQCLKGVEQGLSDTDRCHYFKIADNLYYFVWREKIIPTLGSIMIDLERLKTTGKIMGYDGTDFDKVNNFHVGAFAKVLNETQHTI